VGDLYNYTGPLPDKLEPHHRVRKLSPNLKVGNLMKCHELVGQLILQQYLTDILVERTIEVHQHKGAILSKTLMVIAPNQTITE
jgi:hypothetical protein